MFFLLSKLLDVFLSPYTWGLLLFALTVPWRTTGRARASRSLRRRRIAGGLGLGLLLFASLAPVSNGLLWGLEHDGKPTYDPSVTYDAVILLGGVVDDDAMKSSGQISYNDNVERLIVTHRLVRDGKARIVVVSGESPEAEILARQLEDWGIARERIALETRARNTHENALYSQALARDRGFDRVLVVTSAFHMPRAIECFAAVGMKIDALPVDFRARQSVAPGEWILPRARELALSSMVLREIMGRVIYRVQGYGKPAP